MKALCLFWTPSTSFCHSKTRQSYANFDISLYQQIKCKYLVHQGYNNDRTDWAEFNRKWYRISEISEHAWQVNSPPPIVRQRFYLKFKIHHPRDWTKKSSCERAILVRGPFSQLVEAYAQCERLAGWLELVNDAFYLVGSAVFQCTEYHWTTKVGQKTFYFSFSKVFAGLTPLLYCNNKIAYLLWESFKIVSGIKMFL
jgi:hypothetical protein